MKSRVAIFPGSFDPFTKGHYDVVTRGLRLFDKIIIALGYNSQKKRYFDPYQMCSLIQSAFSEKTAIEVLVYNKLTANLAREQKAYFLIRGLRNTTDFELENSVSQLNKSIHKSLETVFLITSSAYSGINSSLVRELHQYGGNIAPYLPYSLPESFSLMK